VQAGLVDEPTKAPAENAMRIRFDDIESAKSIAKKLARETSNSLSTCQEALARASGYANWHELSNSTNEYAESLETVSLDRLALLISFLAKRLSANGGDVQYALSTSPAIPRSRFGVADHMRLRAAVFRYIEIPDLGRRKPGAVGRFKNTKELLILRRFAGAVLCIKEGSANAAVADFEFVSPRVPLPLFIPARLYLAYGIWTEEDGSEVLFSRDYMPLWRLRKNERPARVSPIEWIKYTDQRWFWTDADAPWDDVQRTRAHIRRLEDFGVRGAPRLVEILPALVFSERTSSLRSTVQSYFQASENEAENLLMTLSD